METDKQPSTILWDLVVEAGQYHAELENWHINWKGTLSGNIFNDKKKRWADGTFVNTSFLKAYTPEGYIQTNNTVYKLLNPSEEALLENPKMKEELDKIIERYQKERH